MLLSLPLLTLLSGAAQAEETASSPAVVASTDPATEADPRNTPAPAVNLATSADVDGVYSGDLYPESSPERGRAMRPLTYPANPRLSQAKIVNFYSLYVDPNTAAEALKPATPALGGSLGELGGTAGRTAENPPSAAVSTSVTSTLPLANRTTGWLEVAVDGTKIGVLGPLTTGAIHGVKAGEYVVQLTNSTGYTETARVHTTDDMPEILIPGNAAAALANEETYQAPGYGAFQPNEVPAVRHYNLPAPPAAAPDASNPPSTTPAPAGRGEKAPR